MTVTEVEAPARKQTTIPVDPPDNPVDKILWKIHRAFSKDEFEWVKGRLYQYSSHAGGYGYDGFCLMGGIDHFGRGADRLAAEQRLMDTIKEYEGYVSRHNVPQWNDRQKTTKQDVLNVLERAIVG